MADKILNSQAPELSETVEFFLNVYSRKAKVTCIFLECISYRTNFYTFTSPWIFLGKMDNLGLVLKKYGFLSFKET